jgi:uroporphyrinogen-III synthase
MRSLGIPPEAFARVRSAAVGERTASALTTAGIPVVVVPETFSGASLAAALGSSLGGKRVLVVRGDIARETVADALKASGASVEAVTVYATTAPGGIDRERIVRRVLGGEFDVVTFASPSSATHFSSLFTPGELDAVARRARIAVIGPSTAEAARGLGLTVDIIAEESTAGGLVRSIEEYYGARQL